MTLASLSKTDSNGIITRSKSKKLKKNKIYNKNKDNDEIISNNEKNIKLIQEINKVDIPNNNEVSV